MRRSLPACPRVQHMPSILFVCTANQFRSPLAAACMNEFIGTMQGTEKWRVESAGTWAQPGFPAAPQAVKAAERLGLNGLEAHRSRPVDQSLLDGFDLIVTMETGQLEGICSEFHSAASRVRLLSEIVEGISYNIPDPFRSDDDPQEVAADLHELIKKGGGRILDLARALNPERQLLKGGNV